LKLGSMRHGARRMTDISSSPSQTSPSQTATSLGEASNDRRCELENQTRSSFPMDQRTGSRGGRGQRNIQNQERNNAVECDKNNPEDAYAASSKSKGMFYLIVILF